MPAEKAELYLDSIFSWFRNADFNKQDKTGQPARERWFIDGSPEKAEADFEGFERFKTLTGTDWAKVAEEIDEWRREWLTDAGWKRVQANVRQKRFLAGDKTLTGTKQWRNRIRSVPVSSHTYYRLQALADGKMSMGKAIEKMLDAMDSLSSGEEGDPFALVPDNQK
ncbi:hypothetical protein [Endozoicomonas sp. ALC066]|uniref:hypothetical protein n=1 Tax=Endozoicomonas sp. ALC066 TaxID=3403078 RepID=UPI003BB5825B